MNPFVRFMSSSAGRVLRILAGIALIAWGVLGMGGNEGYLVAAIGVVPLLTGLLDICLFAPLFGCPLSGCKVRASR